LEMVRQRHDWDKIAEESSKVYEVVVKRVNRLMGKPVNKEGS
jgi:hypothetical protein